MNRWFFVGLMGAFAAGCGDDTTSGTGGAGGSGGSTTSTTSTSTGDGGGDTGGGGPGGEGGGAAAGCRGPGECAEGERCEFRDGLCGAGDAGTCVLRSPACGDTGPERTCLCSGAIVDVDYTCDDDDADSTGACDVPADSFACNDSVCEAVPGAYCHITSDDTGGADYAGCGQTEEPSCGEVPTCACLTAEIEACGGTCEDGPERATVRCPGG